MKKIVSLILLILLSIGLQTRPISADSSIEGETFEVVMNVAENGVITVTETVGVDFKGYNQGIYVHLPQRYIMNFGNGKKDYYFPIKNFQMISHDEVSVDSSSDYVEVRIGTAGEYITGPKMYQYRYEIHTQDLNLSNDGNAFDLFYMNIIGPGWDFGFENVSFEINFPKTLDNTVYVYATQDNIPVPFETKGNQIIGSFEGLPSYQGITIETVMPDGYFNFPSNDFTAYPLIVLAIITIITILLYPKLGKEYPVVETIGFKGPEDISSAEAGYVYRGHNKPEDIISLIVYWASKGYLKLIELEDLNIEIHKVKDLESSNEVEVAIFKQLFIKSDITSTQELTNKFAPTIQYGVTHIADRFRRTANMRIFERAASSFKALASVGVVIAVAALGASIGYRIIPMASYAFIGGVAAFLIAVVLLVLGILSFSVDGISTRSRNKIKGIPFVIGYGIIAFGVYHLFFQSKANSVIFIVVCLLLLVAIAAIANMGKRTLYGVRKYGDILGLKRFIETAEIERLKMFAEETPNLFYDLLPYTYVLGLTDVWMKKFETINLQQPDWYQSNSNSMLTDIYIMNSLSRSMTSLNQSMTSIPQPTTRSGGGNFGGGFGSGGGFGGSGGGGFGGSGGGGW